jgi:hypothetical protein
VSAAAPEPGRATACCGSARIGAKLGLLSRKSSANVPQTQGIMNRKAFLDISRFSLLVSTFD